LDYYHTEENIKKAFVEFANKVPFYGCVAINGNDKNSVELMKDIRRPYIVYGIEANEKYCDLDFIAKDISHGEETSKFVLHYMEKSYPVEISLSGDHNVSNAIGAIAISYKSGVDLKDACQAITNFHGVGRRFENLYKDEKLVIIDDYGHHPTEINATLKTAKVKYPKHKIIAIFEPHRFTRTKEFWNEFVNCFSEVDQVYISPIYAASEEAIEYIDSEILVKNINEKFDNAQYIDSFDCLASIFDEFKNGKAKKSKY
jgi:UDP-N-acetylmuramate--alanine ligase